MDFLCVMDGKMTIVDMIEKDLEAGDEKAFSLVSSTLSSKDNSLSVSNKSFNTVDSTEAFKDNAAPMCKVDPASIFESSFNAKAVDTSTTTVASDNHNINIFVNPTTGIPVQNFHSTPALSPRPSKNDEQHRTATTTSQSSQVYTSLKSVVKPSFNLPVVQRKSLLPQLHNMPSVKNSSHHQTLTHHLLLSSNLRKLSKESQEPVWPKPVYSYSCLIGMALKNSETGALPVSEIYSFMT